MFLFVILFKRSKLATVTFSQLKKFLPNAKNTTCHFDEINKSTFRLSDIDNYVVTSYVVLYVVTEKMMINENSLLCVIF